MKIDDVISRCSEKELEGFIGKSAFEVLKATISPDIMRPENLRDIVLKSIPTQAMLQNEKTRKMIIFKMKENELEKFAKFLKIPQNNQRITNALIRATFTKKRIKSAVEFFDEKFEEDEIVVRKDTDKIKPYDKYLFPHQVKTVKRIQEKLDRKPHKALLHMPTGSGKTFTAMNVIHNILLNNYDALVVWLTSTDELCEQAYQEFGDLWKKSGNRPMNLYRFYDTSRLDLLDVKSGFISAGLSKMISQAKKSINFLPKLAANTSLVIIDEAHMSVAEKYSIVIKELSRHDNTKLLGLSATPGRSKETETLVKFFAGEKILLDTGDENPITFLTRQEYLAERTFKMERAGNTLTKSDIEKIKNSIDVPEKILKNLSKDAVRNTMIVREMKLLYNKHKKIIMFAASMEHAQIISSIFVAHGFNSKYITSETPSALRVKILDDYKNGDEKMIICNYGILTTGFDAPRTSAVLIARPTKSHVLYAQMVGRGMRGPKAGGNKNCEIVTIVDNIEEFENITDIFMAWEETWQG